MSEPFNLAELADRMRMGQNPVMTERKCKQLGEEILDLMHDPDVDLAREMAEAVRHVLVKFGAIEADDYDTSIVTMLEILLPEAAK